MAPYESHELRRGIQYAKLDAPVDDDVETPTRFSSDSTGTLEDLEEHDPLAFDSKIRRKKSKGDLKIRRASYRDRDSESAAPFPVRPAKSRIAPGRCCCWLLVFLAATVLILATGGIWAYKVSAPEDGLSPPWYPSPKGGTDKAWEESYKKAAALVKQMTLPEKVNITTGTGWAMDLCVGQTGRVDRLKFPSLCLQVRVSVGLPSACANKSRTDLWVFASPITSLPSPLASQLARHGPRNSCTCAARRTEKRRGSRA